jgi:hypothetical protein
MKVWGITELDAYRAADLVSVRIVNMRRDGRALRFTLKPTANKKWQRRSASSISPERKVNAICFHGHYHFMRELFRINENARIKTRFADYKGLAIFLDLAPQTGTINIGSRMYPVQVQEACFCYESGDDYITPERVTAWDGSPDTTRELLRVAEMRQADMLACPHVIIDPAHYRSDGSCRCNDPTEQARLISEYDYKASDFPVASR